MDDGQSARAKDILWRLMKWHIDNQVRFRIVRQEDYQGEIKDFALVDDQAVAFVPIPQAGDPNPKIVVSFAPEDLSATKRMWQHLYDNSMDFSEWKSKYYEQWMLGKK